VSYLKTLTNVKVIYLRWNFGAIVLIGEKQVYSKKKLSHSYFFLSASATWTLLEMNAGLRVEKLATSRLSYDTTVLKFPVWFLDSHGSTDCGWVLFLILFFRSEPYLLEYTASRKRTANLTTAILKQQEEGTHARRKEGKKFVVFQVSTVHNFR